MPMNINLTPQLEDQVRVATLAQRRQDIQHGLDSGSAGELDMADINTRGPMSNQLHVARRKQPLPHSRQR